MLNVTSSMCPSCFREGMHQGTCTICGFNYANTAPRINKMVPFSVLHGRYLVGTDIGQGGFGLTYRAKDLQTGRLCCIKEYFPISLVAGRRPDQTLYLAENASQKEYEQGKQRFLEEAKALQELRGNVSVVDIWDYFEENETAYFVMELLEGCNLRVFQREHSPEQNYKMSMQMVFLIGSALVEVHRYGMIHGDISPENIIITQSGDIKLIDFGASRSFQREQGTDGGKIYLKPNYAPYEQYSTKLNQGPWTDLYALAATFYFVVSNTRMIDALSRAKGKKYVPLCELSPFVSQKVSQIMDSALAFDYRDRYKNLTTFMSDLSGAVNPRDYDIDLAALVRMPAEAVPASMPDVGRQKSESRDEVRPVKLQNMAEHGFFGGLFQRKKHKKMAWLELTIRDAASGSEISRRRWLVEPNRVLKIGRLASSDVMMPANNLISRTHCELSYNEEKQVFELKDVSKFGTFFADGTRMEKNRTYNLKDQGSFCVISPVYKFKVEIEK